MELERSLLQEALALLERACPALEERSLLVDALKQLDELFLLVVVGEFNSGKSSVSGLMDGLPNAQRTAALRDCGRSHSPCHGSVQQLTPLCCWFFALNGPIVQDGSPAALLRHPLSGCVPRAYCCHEFQPNPGFSPDWSLTLTLTMVRMLSESQSDSKQPRSYPEPPYPAQVINALLGGRYLEEGILPTTNEISVLKFAEDGVGSMEQNADGFFVRSWSGNQVELKRNSMCSCG